MQKDIHPEYGTMEVSCICGNSFEVSGTILDEKVKIEDCPSCHPVYTGEEKNIEKDDRVARWKEKQKAMQQKSK